MNRERLFGRLGTLAYEAVVEATALCKQSEHEFIELEHWLISVLRREQSDISELLSHFKGDPGILLSQLQRQLARFPRRHGCAIDISSRLDQAMESALATSQLIAPAQHIRSGHVLLGLLENSQTRQTLYRISSQFERIQWPDASRVFEQVGRGWREARDRPMSSPEIPLDVEGEQAADSDALTRWATNLTEQAKQGGLDPVIGRDNELRQVIDILLRRRQNNPILVGEAGVGKTAIVEALAQRIADGMVPGLLAEAQVWVLDLARLQAGASMKGEFEARLKSVVDAIEKSPTPIILFCDEAHTLVGAGGQAGTGDAVNMLKPMLARGKLRMVAATTWSEYKQFIEPDAALTRRMQPVVVDEPGENEAITMLRMIAERFSKHHGVRITNDALVAAVKLSKRHLPSRHLPDKAISLLDTACARVAMSRVAPPAALERERQAVVAMDLQLAWAEQDEKLAIDCGFDREALQQKRAEHQAKAEALEQQVNQARQLVGQVGELLAQPAAAEGNSALAALTGELDELQQGKPLVQPWVDQRTVAAVLSEWTGIPDIDMVTDDIEATLQLRERLEKRVFGQTGGIVALSKALQVARAGIHDPQRPLGVFMLTGPTGTGKTETAIALSELLFGGSHNLIQFNMNEFQEAHTAATLKGAPPGYVGYGKGGVLTEAVRRKPYSVVLLDEFDKAHRDVHEVFYQVFDRGWMEDGEGRRVSFRNCLILMTSNIGAEEIEVAALAEQPATYGQLVQLAQGSLQRHFAPALLARMQVLPFYPLGLSALQSIAEHQFQRLADRLEEQGVTLEIDTSAVEWVANTAAGHPHRGRAIEDLIRATVLPSLAQELLAAKRDGLPLGRVRVVADGGLSLELLDRESEPENLSEPNDADQQEVTSCA
ncbi:type VI secretion system ATPase TssH [Azonexus sp.]|uniref:type VI secretion system ATPase TssH n=1 Tax=Azonexus sp. TaxID=1872668 RepID=UPI0035B3C7C0